jgi:U3 small nucleolar RNA-associated protein 15
VLRLLLKHVTDPRFGEIVCDVAGVVIGKFFQCVKSVAYDTVTEMYSAVLGQSPLIDSLFLRLRKKVTAEIRFQKELVKAKGALEMLFASSALTVA